MQSYPQLPRGETVYGPTATIDTNDYVGVDNEGAEAKFPNVDANGVYRSMGFLYARLMRNVSGVTMYANRLVTHKADYRNRRFDGYSRTTACEAAGVIDPMLPAGGIRNGDACWVFFKGPVQVYTGLALAANLAAGDLAYAITADNSTGHTGGGKIEGRPLALTFTATETTDGTMGKVLANNIGVLMEAATSGGETNTLKYVDLKIR